MCVGNYLGAFASYMRGSRTAGGPFRFETQGFAADGSADSPELWREAVSTNAHRLCRVLLAFLFALPVYDADGTGAYDTSTWPACD